MAINPVTTTRQWYSYANVAFTPATANECMRRFLWTWKTLLTSSYSSLTGTQGPEGARPSSANWTVEQSCDGTNSGATDYWTDYTKVNPGNAGAAHAWIIMKSPATFGNYGSVTGQGPVWMLLAFTAYTGSYEDYRALVYFSREAFVPHPTNPTLNRPTSPKEFSVPYASTAGSHPQLYESTVFGVPRYVSISIDAHGQWFITMYRAGGGVVSCNYCVENINSDDRDLYRHAVAIGRIGNPWHHAQRTWTGTARSQDWNPINGHTSGGLIQWVFGAGMYNSTPLALTGNLLSNFIPGIHQGFIVGVTNSGYNSGTAGSNPESLFSPYVDADGYWLALPFYVLDYGSGHFGNRANNQPQWRGQVPDAWFIPNGMADGSSYPSAAAQTHVAIFNTGTFSNVPFGPNYLIPMSVQLLT